MDLLFDFCTVGRQRASIVGTMTRPLTITTTGPVDLLGIRFRPGGFSGLFLLDADELTDGRVDLADLWGHWAQEFWNRLAEASTTERVSLANEMLCHRISGSVRVDPFIQHCVARIEAARGALRIADLDTSTGLSARQLERKFARHVGISPKTFARIVRFRAVSTTVEELPAPNWARLAADFGFADQAHLIREFRAFSGVTPSCYLGGTDKPS